jgi:hypothetical protein
MSVIHIGGEQLSYDALEKTVRRDMPRRLRGSIVPEHGRAHADRLQQYQHSRKPGRRASV